MIDIETLSLSKNSVILQIAAVSFAIPSFEILDTISFNIDIQSCLDIGLCVDGDTIEYWMKNNDNFSLFQHKINIQSALSQLNDYIRKFTENKKYDIWCLGASFDFAILQNAYKKCHIIPEWSFYYEKCLRTLEIFGYKSSNTYPKHLAINDCYNQIEGLKNVYNSLSILQKE